MRHGPHDLSTPCNWLTLRTYQRNALAKQSEASSVKKQLYRY